MNTNFNPKYVIAYPFGGRPVPCDWHLAVRSMNIPTNCRLVEIFRRAYDKPDGTRVWPLEDSQTSMVEEALGMNADYILFIEDDTIPPPHTIMELGRVLENSDDSVMACGGVYTTRCYPPEPLVFIEAGKGAHWDWRLGDIFPVLWTGMGCMMIKMKIFKEMEKPWFKECKSWDEVRKYIPAEWSNVLGIGKDIPFPEHQARTGLSTDFFFFSKLKNMGYKVLAHGGVLPVHWDTKLNTGFWLPKDTIPTRNIEINGKPYGWVDDRISKYDLVESLVDA